MEFTLGFGDKIGKEVTLTDKSEYYCGDYIAGRYYSGIFNGTFTNDKGLWFRVGKDNILISDTTKIKFDENGL